jgi:hypothetical protein
MAFDSTTYNLLRLIFIFPWCIIEIFRISNGYYGNIKESFPEIISFLLLTIFNIIVNLALLVFPDKFPLETSVLII